MIVAKKSKNNDLVRWIKLELEGYFSNNKVLQESDSVPEYRMIVGLYRDQFGNAVIIKNPKLSFVNEYRLRYGVVKLETMSNNNGEISLFDSDLIKLVSENLNINVHCFSFDPGSIIVILDLIRNELIERLYENNLLNIIDENYLKKNRYDFWIWKFKNNKLVSLILIIALVVAGLSGFLDNFMNVYKYANKYVFSEKEIVKKQFVTIKVKNTTKNSHDILNFVEYSIDEMSGRNIVNYYNGRQSYYDIDEETINIDPEEEITLFIELPQKLLSSNLYNKGSGDMYISIFVSDMEKKMVEFIAFYEESIDKYYIKYTIEEDNNVEENLN